MCVCVLSNKYPVGAKYMYKVYVPSLLLDELRVRLFEMESSTPFKILSSGFQFSLSLSAVTHLSRARHIQPSSGRSISRPSREVARVSRTTCVCAHEEVGGIQHGDLRTAYTLCNQCATSEHARFSDSSLSYFFSSPLRLVLCFFIFSSASSYSSLSISRPFFRS